MATTKTLRPTNVTISIPEFTDQPDQRVNSNCIDKEADAINTLSEQLGGYRLVTYTGTTPVINTAFNTGVFDFHPYCAAVVAFYCYNKSNNTWYDILSNDSAFSAKPFIQDTNLRFTITQAAYSESDFRAVFLVK